MLSASPEQVHLLSEQTLFSPILTNTEIIKTLHEEAKREGLPHLLDGRWPRDLKKKRRKKKKEDHNDKELQCLLALNSDMKIIGNCLLVARGLREVLTSDCFNHLAAT